MSYTLALVILRFFNLDIARVSCIFLISLHRQSRAEFGSKTNLAHTFFYGLI